MMEHVTLIFTKDNGTNCSKQDSASPWVGGFAPTVIHEIGCQAAEHFG
jgi:hypothetical protein